jgi:hypothetical protein
MHRPDGLRSLKNKSRRLLRLAGPFVLSMHSPGNGEAGARARLASRILGSSPSTPLQCPYRKGHDLSEFRIGSAKAASLPSKTPSWRDGTPPQHPHYADLYRNERLRSYQHAPPNSPTPCQTARKRNAGTRKTGAAADEPYSPRRIQFFHRHRELDHAALGTRHTLLSRALGAGLMEQLAAHAS